MDKPVSKKKLFLNAARDGDFGLVLKLLDEGVFVDVRSRYKSTALIRASGCGHYEIVRLLLERGADVDAFNSAHETALYRAAGSGDHALVQLLVSCDACIDGCTAPWSLGPCSPLEPALLNGHFRVADFLYAPGANPNLAMAAVVWRQRVDLLDKLLSMGADVDEGTHHGYTPLMRSATGGHLDMTLALLARGANPNARSQSDETPLGQALRFMLFGNVSYFPVVVALLQHGARCQFLNEAVLLADAQMVQQLLEEGGSPEDTRPFGLPAHSREKPLFNAVDSQNLEIVKLLLDSGANPNFKTPYRVNQPERPLLDLALEKGNQRIVNALLDAGATSMGPAPAPQQEARDSGP